MSGPRWLALASALVCAGCVGIIVASSCAVPGFDLVESSTNLGGAGGTAGEGPTAGGGGVGACDNIEPPLAPSTTDPGSDIDFVAAVRTLDFGEDFDKDAGPVVGYDLDARCTCLGDAQSCATVGNEPEECDGPRGRDNAVARLFDNLSLFEPDSFNSQYHSARANLGAFGLLFRVRDWNGAPNDESVTLAIYTSAGIDQDPCDPNAVPAWDGTDVWPVDIFSVNTGGGGGAGGGVGGSGAAGGGSGGGGGAGGCDASAPGYDLDDPVFVSEFGYVTEGVLVANLPEAGIALGVEESVVGIKLAGGFVTARIEEVGGRYFLRSGIMTGRWGVSDFFGVLGTITTNGEPICRDNGLYGPIKEIVCNYADIHVGVSGSASPCDAMSFGMAFEAEPALLGNVIDTAGMGGSATCPPGQDPTGDDCSDQGM